jgi:hypothetical protein
MTGTDSDLKGVATPDPQANSATVITGPAPHHVPASDVRIEFSSDFSLWPQFRLVVGSPV